MKSRARTNRSHKNRPQLQMRRQPVPLNNHEPRPGVRSNPSRRGCSCQRCMAQRPTMKILNKEFRRMQYTGDFD